MSVYRQDDKVIDRFTNQSFEDGDYLDVPEEPKADTPHDDAAPPQEAPVEPPGTAFTPSDGETPAETRGAADAEEIRRALSVLTLPGQLIEVRSFHKRPGQSDAPRCGFFVDPEALIRYVLSLTNTSGVYFTLNPIDPDSEVRGKTTGDENIAKRRWLLVDFDTKPHNAPSTAEEKAHTVEAARQFCAWLLGEFGVRVILADSGNGTAALVPVDLPNNPESLAVVERFLRAIAHLYNNQHVDIDTAVGNASRIWKLPGTRARKGEETRERQYHMARLLDVPEDFTPVSREVLERIVKQVPSISPAPSPTNTSSGAPTVAPTQDDPDWLKAMGTVDDGEQNKLLIALAGKYVRSLADERLWPGVLEMLWARVQTWPINPSRGPWTFGHIKTIYESACRMERERRADERERPWNLKPGARLIVPIDLYDRTQQKPPDQQWLIPHLLPSGKIVVILGKPKKGKSTMGSQEALAVVDLRPMWTTNRAGVMAALPSVVQVPREELSNAEVLICSLEEDEDNVASRVRKQLANTPIPARNRITIIEPGPIELRAFLNWLDDWMVEHPNLRLVILDPWVLVIYDDDERNPYLREYNKFYPLRQFQRKHPNVTFQIHHHARKAGADEVTDANLGTSGTPGAADVTVWLQRERQELTAVIEAEGRVGKALPKIEILLDEETLRWDLVGLARKVTEERNKDLVETYLAVHGDGFTSVEFADEHKKTDRWARDMLGASGLVKRDRRGRNQVWVRSGKPDRRSDADVEADDAE